MKKKMAISFGVGTIVGIFAGILIHAKVQSPEVKVKP